MKIHFLGTRTTSAGKMLRTGTKRLQDQYDKNDTENQRLSGFGGWEMGELADLLVNLPEARDDCDAHKKYVKMAEKKRRRTRNVWAVYL